MAYFLLTFVAFDTEQGFEAIGYVKVLTSEPNATP